MVKNLSVEIAKLEEELAKKKARQKKELRAQLKAARAEVLRLEAKFAAATGKSETSVRRKRTPPDEVRELIDRELGKTPKGLTQMQVRTATDLPYGTIVQYFGRNKKSYRRKGKRWFLK